MGKLGLLEPTNQLILKKKAYEKPYLSLAFFMWTNSENCMMFGTSGALLGMMHFGVQTQASQHISGEHYL